MEYFLIQCKTYNGEVSQGIFRYPTRDEAEIQYHKAIAYDMEVLGVSESLVEVINSTGSVEMSKHFTRETEVSE